MRKVLTTIKKWWEGKYIPPSNDPNSCLVFIMGRQKYPLLRMILGILAKFWLKHWQWIIVTTITITITVIGIILSKVAQ